MQKQFFVLSQSFYGKHDNMAKLNQQVNSIIQKLTDGYKNIDKIKKAILSNFLKVDINEQRKILDQKSTEIFSAIQDTIDKASTDKQLMALLITTLDGILSDDKKVIKESFFSFTKENAIFLETLANLLQQDQDVEGILKISAIVLSNSQDQNLKKGFLKDLMRYKRHIYIYCSQNQLKISDYNYFICLTYLLQNQELVDIFIEKDGFQDFKQFLNQNNFDLQPTYYCFLNIWLCSFSQQSYQFFLKPELSILKQMILVITLVSREKLIRIAFSTFKDAPNTIEIMVECGIIKVIDAAIKINIKDQEIVDDIQFVEEIVEKNLKILTSFDKYVKEVDSQNLQWGPIHSEKFWKENVKKFEDKDFIVIKKLIQLLDSNNEKNVEVACYDLGEFSRFHPFGKNVLENLQGKELISQKARSNNALIKEQALVALQKLMINNWQAIVIN